MLPKRQMHRMLRTQRIIFADVVYDYAQVLMGRKFVVVIFAMVVAS